MCYPAQHFSAASHTATGYGARKSLQAIAFTAVQKTLVRGEFSIETAPLFSVTNIMYIF